MFTENCKSVEVEMCEKELGWRDEDVRAWATQVFPLRGDFGVLAIRKDDSLLEFACLSHLMSDVGGANKVWTCEFHGYGFTGSLRELRHTWFSPKRDGDSLAHGYVYYINLALYIEALQLLGTWFDGN